MNADIMWKALEWPGLEHLEVRERAGGIAADGVVLARLMGAPVRLFYRLECGRDWRVRRVLVELPQASLKVELDSPAAGRWRGARGEPLAEFDGCVDVDIALTPFTNTLPIQRLGLHVGESRDLRMVYLVPPDLRPHALAQRYTCLERAAGHAVYRYESGTFAADLRVDADGIVDAYPSLWERVA